MNEPFLTSSFERSLCFPQSSRSATEWLLGPVILQNSRCSATELAAGSKKETIVFCLTMTIQIDITLKDKLQNINTALITFCP